MSAASVVERVKANLVALKMPRALEILDVTVRGVERGERVVISGGVLLLGML